MALDCQRRAHVGPIIYLPIPFTDAMGPQGIAYHLHQRTGGSIICSPRSAYILLRLHLWRVPPSPSLSLAEGEIDKIYIIFFKDV